MQPTKTRSSLMTSGPIGKQIMLFAVPLLLGNLFQQLYNTVDSAIVGRFVGTSALAAVASSTQLINLVLGFFYGLGVGGSVVISQYFGARDTENLHKAVHTFAAFALISGVITTVVGVGFTPVLLRWMSTPEDVIGLSMEYFRWYFAGSLAMVCYNMGGGLLRAVGDSRRPVYYLVIASIVNIVLDLLFVAGFGWGVRGAALATDISQVVSAVLIIATLLTTREEYRLEPAKIRIWPAQLRRILNIGLPGGVQSAVISLSNVIVQSNINVFGTSAVAGCGAFMKLDTFNVLVIQSIALSMTTFVGQNAGAHQHDRIKKGFLQGVVLCEISTVLISVILYCFTPQLLGIFTADPAAIANGVAMMHLLVFFYPTVAFSHTAAGALRGVGLSQIPMYIMLATFCAFRVAWILLVGRPMHSLTLVLMGYPSSWTLCMVGMLGYMILSDWTHAMERAEITKKT